MRRLNGQLSLAVLVLADDQGQLHSVAGEQTPPGQNREEQIKQAFTNPELEVR